jgi:uncharacterized protein (DUF58 family)
MDARLKEFLKPEILSSVNGLELVARIIVEGFMSGSNTSQSVGVGQEFSQYRNYEAGDDLRQLDWKMYARSERYFIKQAEIETNITVKFMLDASRSMAYEENGITKLHYAKVMMAALGYLARKQGDTFGLFVVNDKNISIIHPRFEQQQFMRFLHELVNARPESKWKKSGIEQLFDHHGKEMIIFITDLYDEDGDLLQFISRLKTQRNEVIVFHLLGQHEKDLDFEGSFTFKDLENGKLLKVDTRTQKKMYTEKIAEWIRHSRLTLLEKSINYFHVSMGDSFNQVLRDFLKARKNIRG